MNDLTGKRALVTGSSRGIGLAIAQALSHAGCLVAVNGRQSREVERIVATLPGAVAVVGDVCHPEEAQRIVSEVERQLGGLDILVCNVGSGKSVPPGAETYPEWQRVFALNLWSTTNMVEAGRKALAANRGAVVCISSICGSEVIPGAPVTYSVAKAALNAYVRGVARPFAADGIRINALAVGNVMFPGSTWEDKWRVNPAAVQEMLNKSVPMARLGRVEEVAEVVLFLASERASFVTGATWTVDGGQLHS
ncbi:MAG: SDR family oxidoreductase [Magnetococcales bacterium]|nr:SDR family oxidoreductase [Magnetococcales bacterium]